MRILVVEDTKVFANMLQRRIASELGFEVVVTTSLASTKQLLRDTHLSFDAALLDLTLTDSYHGEIVDYVAPRMPSIVLTGNMDQETRDKMWEKNIVDYVVKENTESITYVVNALDRLHKNKTITVLLVDDSAMTRRQLGNLLKVHGFQVLLAGDGQQGLEKLLEHPQVKLVITDCIMPRMDGFIFVREIRRIYDKNRLAIIGMSAEGDGFMSAGFLKSGANDFLKKPFVSEEFYCRVNHNIEMLEYIAAIERLSNEDPLTGLYNRRCFFNKGYALVEDAVRTKRTLACIMLDIDSFKVINDTYGHDAGDLVLVRLAEILRGFFGGQSIVARFGGEEFCVLLPDVSIPEVRRLCEQLRAAVEAATVKTTDDTVNFTVSVGCCDIAGASLAQVVRQADALLYEAKRSGKNRVLYSENILGA